MRNFILCISALFILSACANNNKTIKLSKLNQGRPYEKLQEDLSARSDFDVGLFIETRVNATVLHPVMSKYREVPTDGIGVEFLIEGINQEFKLQRYIIEAEDGSGNWIRASGIGTENPRYEGHVEDGKAAQIKLIPLWKISQTDIMNNFILVFPFNIENIKTLRVTGQDSAKPKWKFYLSWNFKK